MKNPLSVLFQVCLPWLMCLFFITGSQSVVAKESLVSKSELKIEPFVTHNLEEKYEAIFRQFLSSELSQKITIIDVSEAEKKATRVASGSLSQLDKKIIVVMQVEDTAGELVFSEKTTIYSLDELDLVAERLAKSYLQQKSFDKTATVNNLTSEESRKKPLKTSTTGFSFEVGGFFPVGGDNYADGDSGVSISLGSLMENEHFFLQPSVSLRKANNGRYREFPLDVSIGKMFRESGATPFVSAGAGIRYIREKRKVSVQSAGALLRTVNQTFKEEETGVGLHIKTGYLFAREDAIRAIVSLRYDISETNPFNKDQYQAISIQTGMLFF